MWNDLWSKICFALFTTEIRRNGWTNTAASARTFCFFRLWTCRAWSFTSAVVLQQAPKGLTTALLLNMLCMPAQPHGRREKLLTALFWGSTLALRHQPEQVLRLFASSDSLAVTLLWTPRHKDTSCLLHMLTLRKRRFVNCEITVGVVCQRACRENILMKSDELLLVVSAGC